MSVTWLPAIIIAWAGCDAWMPVHRRRSQAYTMASTTSEKRRFLCVKPPHNNRMTGNSSIMPSSSTAQKLLYGTYNRRARRLGHVYEAPDLMNLHGLRA
eukprot:5992235-Amphidinium_carterae.2